MNKKIQALLMAGLITANLCINSIGVFAQTSENNATQNETKSEKESNNIYSELDLTQGPKQSINQLERSSWHNPNIYHLVDEDSYAGRLIDDYGTSHDVTFRYVDQDDYDFHVIVEVLSSQHYFKYDYITLEFYNEYNGTLNWVGNTNFDTSGTKNNRLTSLVDKSDYENQEYIYIRLGVSEYYNSSYYSDVITFKVKNPNHKKNGWVQEYGKWYFYINDEKQIGWITDGNKKYYLDTDGVMQTGWLELGNKKYYLNSSGVMLTGWQNINGITYYFNNSGELQDTHPEKNGWIKENGIWYFYKDNVKQIGWLKEGSNWYYLKSNGAMATGWLKEGSNWYYLKSNGVMATGWLKEGSNWYYLRTSGVMATGWLKEGSNYYYLRSSGVMATGWLKEGSNWYYLKSNGVMATGWLKEGSIWYYLKSNGVMACNEIITISNEGNRFAASGKWLGKGSYSAGNYRVGSDIPAGKYVVIPKYKNGSIYFSVSSDPMHNNILFNEFIDGKAFLEVRNGEYLKIEDAYMIPADGYISYPENNTYTDGYYRVGIDIPEGIYNVYDGDGGAAYWAIQDLRGNLYDNDFFYGNSYVYLEYGDVLILSNGACIYI